MLAWIPLFGLTAAQVAFVATTTAIAAGSMMIQRSQAKKAESRSRKAGRQLAEEQAKAAARARAVAQAPISASQMQLVMEQRQLDTLVEEFVRQDQPRVYTLPTAQKSSPVERINSAIHQFITGAA